MQYNFSPSSIEKEKMQPGLSNDILSRMTQIHEYLVYCMCVNYNAQ